MKVRYEIRGLAIAVSALIGALASKPCASRTLCFTPFYSFFF